MEDIKRIAKPRYTESQKRSYAKYYITNRQELRDKQK